MKTNKKKVVRLTGEKRKRTTHKKCIIPFPKNCSFLPLLLPSVGGRAASIAKAVNMRKIKKATEEQ